MSNDVKNELLKCQQNLPKNWKVFHSKKINKVYYYNTETKKTQWEHPSTGGRAHKPENNYKIKKVPNKQKDTNNDNNPTATTHNKTSTNVKVVKKAKVNNTSVKNIQKDSKQTTGVQERQQKTNQKTQKIIPKIKSEPSSVTSEKCANPSSLNSGKISAKTDPSLKGKRKFERLPPLTKPINKTSGSLSEASTSGSSDRIVAWLEDTSHVNFKDYPVPEIHFNEELSDKSGVNNTSPNTKLKKGTVLNNEQNNNGDILDRLLPKHAFSSQKRTTNSRYMPYKTSEVQNKPKTKGIKTFINNKNAGKTEEILNKSNEQTSNNAVQNTKCNARKTPGTTTAGAKKVCQVVEAKETTAIRDNVKDIQQPQPSVAQAVSTTITKSKVNQIQSNESAASFIDNTPKTGVNNVNINNQTSRQNGFDDIFDAMESEEPAAMSQEPTVVSQDDVADMEIDNAEEFAQEIMERLKQIRNNLIVQPTDVTQQQCEMNITNNVGYEGTLYIVLDTNVLLSHLKFVVELKDFPVQGVGRPILVIPWVVIQELDNLKDNKWRTHESKEKEERVDTLARIAIKFLNNSFQKSDPRVRGQTIDEAAQQVGNLKEESNDDRILQCCLLFQERAERGNCILFSNDNNLCNKAIVNGIKAFNHQRLMSGLRDLFQCGAIVKQIHYKEYKEQLEVQENLAWRREKSDEIICELQIILREGLSYIIETEMKEAYAELWLHVVSIKPPWTLVDVLQLLDKHWIAVFGHVLKRNQKSLVENLRKKFDDRKGTPSSLLFASEALELGLKLFQAFAAHSNYDDAVPKCLAAVNVLIQKCQQYKSDASNNILQNTQKRSLTQKATIEEVQYERNIHEEVMDTFNLIWSAVTQFSNQIFTSLGYPNSLPCEADQELQTPTEDEAVQFLGVLAPRLVNLVNSIKNILREPWEKSSQDNNLFVQLELSIAMFLEQVLSRENGLTPQKLFSFCKDSSMRTALVQGLSQLDGASSMLQHCGTCIAAQTGNS